MSLGINAIIEFLKKLDFSCCRCLNEWSVENCQICRCRRQTKGIKAVIEFLKIRFCFVCFLFCFLFVCLFVFHSSVRQKFTGGGGC